MPEAAELGDHRRRVIDDPSQNRVRFVGGRPDCSASPCPCFRCSTSARKRGADWLARPGHQPVHEEGAGDRLALSLADWSQLRADDNSLTSHGRLPAIEANRELNSLGAFQIGGPATARSTRSNPAVSRPANGQLRGYFEANGKVSSPPWSITSSLRVATDKTVTRRYDLTTTTTGFATSSTSSGSRPIQLYHDRRLGLRGAARGRQAKAHPDRAPGDRRTLPHERRRRRHGGSRATASRY